MIVTPEQSLSEHAEKIRRLRKPTLGEIEDMMKEFADAMLQQYGPLAVALRELNFRCSVLENQRPSGGDVE